MDLEIPPIKQGRQVGGDIGLTIISHRFASQGKENRITFKPPLYGAAYPKKSIKGKRLLRPQPPDLYRYPSPLYLWL